MAMKITRMALWKVEKKYVEFGVDGLKTHKSGRLFEPLNDKFYELVVQSWEKNKCGARKLHAILKRMGFCVSRRKIEQVLIAEGFQKSFPKRSKPRKYKRYEWPIPNLMWHTDGHVFKRGTLKGKHFISYFDDCSRKIMSYSVCDSENTKDALSTLYNAIGTHSVVPLKLNSDRGSAFTQSKFDKKGTINHTFQEALLDLGIQFVPSKVRHPQTNGKLEKFHDILEREFDERFKNLDEFINWYNNERASEALDYMTPTEAYKKRL